MADAGGSVSLEKLLGGNIENTQERLRAFWCSLAASLVEMCPCRKLIQTQFFDDFEK